MCCFSVSQLELIDFGVAIHEKNETVLKSSFVLHSNSILILCLIHELTCILLLLHDFPVFMFNHEFT